MSKQFPKRLGLNADNYPDVTDDYEQLKLSLYDQLVSQRGQVAPVVINRLFAEKGPYDTRVLKQFPDPGEYARLNGQIIGPNELNHRLYGLALGASRLPLDSSLLPAHIKQTGWVRQGYQMHADTQEPLPPEPFPKSPIPGRVEKGRTPEGEPDDYPPVDPDDYPPEDPDDYPAPTPDNGQVLEELDALQAQLQALQQQLAQDAALRQMEANRPIKIVMPPDPKAGRIAIDYNSRPIPPSQLSANIDQALWQQRQTSTEALARAPVPQNRVRASWGNPIQGPPVFMAENTVQDLPNPDLTLIAQPQTPRVDPRLARLQQWQRLQAAQEQINSIYQPPPPNILGRPLRQQVVNDPDQIIAEIKQQNLANLQRDLLLLQMAETSRNGKQNNYQENTSRPPTLQELKLLEREDRSPDPLAELWLFIFGDELHTLQDDKANVLEKAQAILSILFTIRGAKRIKLPSKIDDVLGIIVPPPYYEGAVPTGKIYKGAPIFKWKNKYMHIDTLHKLAGDIRVEVYNSNGQHLGEFDGKTGKMIKGPKPGRNIRHLL